MSDPAQQAAKPLSAPEKVWAAVVAAFAPIASLVSMRTLYLALILVGLGFWIGFKDIKLFLLAIAWAIAGIAVAYHGRKFLVPDVKAKEYQEAALAGNVAAAIIVLGLRLVEAAIIVVVAFAALRAGV